MGIERRETGRRAEVVRAVVSHVVQNPGGTVTLDALQETLHVPREAADRIVHKLVSAGIVREVKEGLWARVSDLPPTSAY